MAKEQKKSRLGFLRRTKKEPEKKKDTESATLKVSVKEPEPKRRLTAEGWKRRNP